MADKCNSRCGFCGGCTAPWERTARQDQDAKRAFLEGLRCDTCNELTGPFPVLLTIGVFCSAKCADVATAKRDNS